MFGRDDNDLQRDETFLESATTTTPKNRRIPVISKIGVSIVLAMTSILDVGSWGGGGPYIYICINVHMGF